MQDIREQIKFTTSTAPVYMHLPKQIRSSWPRRFWGKYAVNVTQPSYRQQGSDGAQAS